MGADYTHTSVGLLSHWTHKTRQLDPFQGVSAQLSITFITRRFDYGFNAVYPNPNRIIALYSGPRLTNLTSPVSSFINLELGLFSAIYNHLKPPITRPNEDRAGKIMQLQYNNAFIGLSSKNYLSHLNVKKNSFAVGLNFMGGYFPLHGDWRYGYHNYSGKSSSFISHKVHGIPYLGKYFFSTGITIGFGGRLI